MKVEEFLEKFRESDVYSLGSLYTIISEICADYSKMTDGYSLATGDNKFENMPDDVRNMIEERQRFFSYKNTVKEAIKTRIREMMDYDSE